MKEILKNFTILYVEDEDEVRRNAVEYLRRLCKEVLEARDGKEAIKIWKEHNPDIIITDINRITSYNVCYTKLLRSVRRVIQNHIAFRDDFFIRLFVGINDFHDISRMMQCFFFYLCIQTRNNFV